jgi:hypothetical protein
MLWGMAWWDDRLQEFFAAIMRGMAGLKLGPGVLRTIIPIVSFGFIALAAIAWALASNPLMALVAVALGLGVIVYVVERSFRYAETNPLPALLGGSELLQLFRDQIAARDRTLVVNDPPIVGGGVTAIEHKDGDDV